MRNYMTESNKTIPLPKGLWLPQSRLSPVPIPSMPQYLLQNPIRSATRESEPWPHSSPPLMMLVITPQPGIRPAARSAAEGVHRPVMTSWHDGFGDCGVIQNQRALLKEITGSVATRSGLFNKSSPIALPHCPQLQFLKCYIVIGDQLVSIIF